MQGNTLHRSRQKAQSIRARRLGLNGSKEAQVPKQTSLGQAMTHGIRTRALGQPKYQDWGRLVAVGRPAHYTNRLQSLTWQLLIGPRCRFLEDHLLKSTLLAMTPPYIYEMGEGKNQDIRFHQVINCIKRGLEPCLVSDLE